MMERWWSKVVVVDVDVVVERDSQRRQARRGMKYAQLPAVESLPLRP